MLILYQIADSILVMYAGQLSEKAPTGFTARRVFRGVTYHITVWRSQAAVLCQ